MSKNFLQTVEWSQFWLAANSSHHNIINITIENPEKYQAIAYQYPWKFKQTWLYIPRFGSGFTVDSRKEARQIFKEFISKASQIGKEMSATLLKIDFDPKFFNLLKNEHDEGLTFLSSITNQQIVPSPRKINYLSTIVLNLEDVISGNFFDIKKPNNTELVDFFKLNGKFWKNTNQNIRRYTRKALELEWTVEIDGNNFEEWYKIHKETSERQSFATHSRYYLEQLYKQDFTSSIILRDSQGAARAGWLGGVFGDTIVYLHGGNTQDSFDKFGQYLVHLVAIAIGSQKRCRFYDLGGWEEGKGFSKFKEGYRGEVEVYPGTFDVVLKEPDYFLTRISQWLKTRK